MILQVKEKGRERDEKSDVSLYEDGLTYTLKIKDMKATDTGNYTISTGDLTATLLLFICQHTKKTSLSCFCCFVFPNRAVLLELIFLGKQTFTVEI